MSRTWLFRAATFFSAFLLFQIQPMTAKALLPSFGGSYLVWGTCMVFFQAVLLAGYLYAHVIQRQFGVRRYSRFHVLLLVAPMALCCRGLDAGTMGSGGASLSLSVMRILFVWVGVPVFVLSTTSLLLQRWLSLSNVREKDDPYFLYASSNAGSILGLLSYPLVVEPFMSLTMQWRTWWSAYLITAILQFCCLPSMRQSDAAPNASASATGTTPEGRPVVWFTLAAAACALLLAVTNVITLDIASVPFLWVLPLSVYLLSFVLTFKQNPWYPRWARKAVYWAAIFGALLYLLGPLRLAVPAAAAISLHLLVLFCVCLVCSGEIVISKPRQPQRLTLFYLAIAAGGLAGSMLVSWVAPLVSRSLVEYPMSLALAAIALALCVRPPEARPATAAQNTVRAPVLVGWLVVMALALTLVPWMTRGLFGGAPSGLTLSMLPVAVLVALALLRMAGRPWQFAVMLLVFSVAISWTEDFSSGATTIRKLRNFYGIYKVFDRDNLRYLKHGTTLHGRQYLSGPDRDTPLAYYHPTTPAAGVLTATNEFHFKTVAMIGLGTGALVAYAGAGQSFTILELDPDNVPVAEQDFSYLQIARRRGALLDFCIGDGRVSLRSMRDSSLNLLIVDAFSSGSIPVHLITVEAFEEYFRALGKNGLLLMHVSNKTLNLIPVVYSNARVAGLNVCEKNNGGNIHPDAELTYWVGLSRNPDVVARLISDLGWWQGQAGSRDLPRPWTDQYSNLLGGMIGW